MLDSKLFMKKNKSIWFSIFFTLTIMTRPIEALLILSFPFLFLIWGRYRFYICYNEIVKGITYLVFFLWLLFISRVIPKISSSVIKIDPPHSSELFIYLTMFVSLFLLLLLFLKYYLNKKSLVTNYSKNILFSKCMLFTGLSLWLWFTPRFGSLYGWVYVTSIGGQLDYMKHNNNSILELLNNVLRNNGEVIIYLCILLILINLVASKYKINEISSKFVNHKEKLVNLNIIIMTAIPIPVLLYFLTFQTSYRKISPIITILLLWFLIHILKNKKLLKFNTVVLSVFLLLQIFSLNNHIYQYNNQTFVNKSPEFIKKIIGVGFPQPINSSIKPYNTLLNIISDQKEKKFYQEITLVLKDDAYPIERYLLKFLCMKNLISCKFLSLEKFENNIVHLNKNHEAYLTILEKNTNKIFSKESQIFFENKIKLQSKSTSPANINSAYLNYLITSNKLQQFGLSLKECRNFYENYFACLILKK